MEEGTFKGPAMGRPVVIDAATIVGTQGRAGLSKGGGLARARPSQGKARGLQKRPVVGRLDLDILEEHAIAAEPAGKTEFVDDSLGIHAAGHVRMNPT